MESDSVSPSVGRLGEVTGDDFVLDRQLGFELLNTALGGRWPGRLGLPFKRGCPALEELLLPLIELVGQQLVLLAQIGYRHPVHQVPFNPCGSFHHRQHLIFRQKCGLSNWGGMRPFEASIHGVLTRTFMASKISLCLNLSSISFPSPFMCRVFDLANDGRKFRLANCDVSRALC
jgi:hypothetical protein